MGKGEADKKAGFRNALDLLSSFHLHLPATSGDPFEHPLFFFLKIVIKIF